MMAALIVLADLGKDVSGLIGSGLVAWPFFSQEQTKRLIQQLSAPSSVNPTVQRIFGAAAANRTSSLTAPSGPDLKRMSWGVLLITLSFLLSLASTIAKQVAGAS